MLSISQLTAMLPGLLHGEVGREGRAGKRRILSTETSFIHTALLTVTSVQRNLAKGRIAAEHPPHLCIAPLLYSGPANAPSNVPLSAAESGLPANTCFIGRRHSVEIIFLGHPRSSTDSPYLQRRPVSRTWKALVSRWWWSM